MTDRLGTALITGASGGIGAVYADRLAKRGYDLIVVARDTKKLEELARRLSSETGVKVEVIGADLTDEGDVSRIESLLASPEISLLVNNAGMSLKGSLLENGGDEIGRIVTLNMTTPTRLAAAAAKAFTAVGRGAVINISSVLALAPERFDGVYSGSKAIFSILARRWPLNMRITGSTPRPFCPAPPVPNCGSAPARTSTRFHRKSS